MRSGSNEPGGGGAFQGRGHRQTAIAGRRIVRACDISYTHISTADDE